MFEKMSMGPQVVAALRDQSPLPFDVHLMLRRPLRYIPIFREAGADIISFHIECEDDPEALLRAIEASGAKPGIALKPGTPAQALEPFGDRLATATVMTVEPGFGGQTLMRAPLEKIPWLKRRFPKLLVEVDGGVNRETAGKCIAAGADILVAGTAVFRAEDPRRAMEALRSAKRDGK